MSDTCIVCLGDLGESASDPLAVEPVPRLHLHDGADPTAKAPTLGDEEGSGEIAQLLPCGHILHNVCLKPWVERANSCPICRRSFNMVELSDRPGGPVTSSYAVQDRVQVAEIDPSMVIDYVEDDFLDYQPCTICGESDNEDVLLLCDGCDAPSHVYCVGLDEVPSGSWYCERCEVQRALEPTTEAPARPSRTNERRTRRTRGQQRQAQSRNQINSLHWARVWQSVWDHLNIDLDFPFDDDRSAQRVLQQRRREEANQREFRAWQRRFEVAERQGGGSRFRDSASLFDIEPARPSRPRVPRNPTPEPESLEEMRAWNAFERAREIENNPSAARKRKEPTLSPSPEPTEPQRKLKRPRTRRPQELAAMAQQNGESSRAASASASGSGTNSNVSNVNPNANAGVNLSTNANARVNGDASGEPSFLSSLLKEVEDASTTERTTPLLLSAPTSIAPTDHVSPGPSSPSISPVSSNHSSPRLSSTTPPPYSRSRPISPFQLSSPVEPSSPPFSPEVSFSGSPISPSANREKPTAQRETNRPRSRIPRRVVESSHPPSADTSPTRAGPSLAVKVDIRGMVSMALKPHYRSKTISREEYTETNRTISRVLYDRVGTVETLSAEARADLENTANFEVQKTVGAIHKNNQVDRQKQKQKQKQPMAAADSDGDIH
ncbi:uncharacterized protein N7473_004722 [Penicillium subrubescens]|uniref:PHD and RING finger domain-containing protein n=1 Tax=Penicillium subrubescens TaxID=1316194 RepID=A0A1Q5UHJ0_9EURO|nr:uncharacterized protein N7473_004722 [Penicillium subrubescens]KAJ5900652.1 hypothetical protein N7473_004722 [Penicillium subrubescens]OKP11955.1 PHD and RING finger domain-containing protein [Penicillium subrubescens]